MSVRHLYRVDPRLVHATLMNAWVPALGCKKLLIVDSDVAADPRARTILAMSAMDVNIDFVREDDASGMKGVFESSPVIVLFASLASAERALAAGLALTELNIGHLPEAPGRVQVVPAVHLGSHDRAIIRRLERRGVSVYVQPLPRDEKIPVRDLDSTGERKPSGLFSSQTADMPVPNMIDRSRFAHVSSRASMKLRVVNERGLHLRAAHALAHLAASLPENVQVSHGPDSVNAKSLLGLTTLGATCGTVLEVVVTGPNPTHAIDKIRALFASGFDEGAKPGMKVEVDA